MFACFSQAIEIPTKLLYLLLSTLVVFVVYQRQLGAMTASPVVVTSSNCVASLQQMFLEPDTFHRNESVGVGRGTR
jgi:hypothetical protein